MLNTPIIASLFALVNFPRQGAPTPPQRKYIFHLVLSVGFFATILLSQPLWTSDRDFPLVPVLEQDWNIPLPSDTLFLCLLGASILSLLVPRRNITTALLAILCLAAMAEDINRVHPWMLYFTVSFIALALSKQRDRNFLNTLRILTISIYFWSGFHKWNQNFFEQTWPYMLEGILGNDLANSWLQETCYAVPIIEAGLGIGLAFPRTRTLAIAGLIGMHCFILLALGPLGRNYNPVVWPWNIVMLFNLLVLFGREKEWRLQFRISRRIFHNLIILLFCLLPILHTFYIWPPYLSWSIYSKKQSSLAIVFDHSSKDCILEDLVQIPPKEGEIKTVYLLNWANEILKTPNFPSDKVYKAFVKKICDECPSARSIDFIAKERKWGKWTSELLNCPQD